MFGYVKPVAAELKVKEYELYRAVYCGLCGALGRSVSPFARLTLSYDFVFLALMRMSLAEEKGKIGRRRCFAHPMKKRSVLMPTEQLNYCAKISAVFTYHKLLDDRSDQRGFKKLAAALLLVPASSMRKRAGLGEHPEAFIREKLCELSALEKQGCDSVDQVAEPFGELLAEVFAFGFAEGDSKYRIAKEIGRHLGRFIYIADALDDLMDDCKNGAYNPFLKMYGEDFTAKLQADLPMLERALTMELVGIEAAVELMSFDAVPSYEAIIRNIIYLGLPEQMRRVFAKASGGSTTDEKSPAENLRDNGEQIL